MQKIYLAAFFQTLERILGAIVFVIIGLVLFVLMPTLTKQKGYVHKIKFLFTRPFGEKFGAYKYWIIVGIIFFSYTLFSDAGYYSAAKQKAFYVVNTDPETVMLEVNDDLALCFRFDRDRKIVGNEFTIVDVSNREELIYTYEEVGPLKIEGLTNYEEILPDVTSPTPDNMAHP